MRATGRHPIASGGTWPMNLMVPGVTWSVSSIRT
jgi:hypothetical protein